MRILVLGGARKRFFSLYSDLKASGHEVVVIDNLTKESFAGVSSDVKFIFADVLDQVLLSRVIKDTQAEVLLWDIDLSLEKSNQDALKTLELRHLGLLRVLNAVFDQQVIRFGIVDSSAVDSTSNLVQDIISDFTKSGSDKDIQIFREKSMEALCKSILI